MNMKTHPAIRSAVALILMVLLCASLFGCGSPSPDGTPETEVPVDSSPEESTPRERTHSLEDFDGWWLFELYNGSSRYIYIDAEAETFTQSDKYLNLGEAQDVEYDSGRDQIIFYERYATDDLAYHLSEDGGMDVLYQYGWGGDFHETLYDVEEPVAYRCDEPVAPEVPLDIALGSWYLDGDIDSRYYRCNEDGSYEVTEEPGGSYAVEMYESYGVEGIRIIFSLESNPASLSDDRTFFTIPYYYADRYTGMGTPLYAGSHLYVHEDYAGTPEAHDAIQSFNLTDHGWLTDDGGDLRMNLDGFVSYYSYEAGYGYHPEIAGEWAYEAGVLTITWKGDYSTRELEEWDEYVIDEVEVEDVLEGFTLPLLGRIEVESLD